MMKDKEMLSKVKTGDKKNFVFDNELELLEVRLRKLEKELKILREYGDWMMSEEALRREMEKLEAQMSYYKAILKELERKSK